MGSIRIADGGVSHINIRVRCLVIAALAIVSAPTPGLVSAHRPKVYISRARAPSALARRPAPFGAADKINQIGLRGGANPERDSHADLPEADDSRHSDDATDSQASSANANAPGGHRSNEEQEAEMSTSKETDSHEDQDCADDVQTTEVYYNDKDGEEENKLDLAHTPEQRARVSPETETETEADLLFPSSSDSEEGESSSGEDEDASPNDGIDMDDPTVIRRNAAAELRIVGKELHDSGDISKAADTFRQAASELDGGIAIIQALPSDEKQAKQALLAEMIEEGATCRLHEALCHLKRKEYALCIQSCTGVLDDGVQIVPLDYDDEAVPEDEGGESKDEENTIPAGAKKAAVIRITPTGGGGAVMTGMSHQVSPAAKARAYHRRAKARLALGDATGALEDAKSAAFLGDRNAVSLYGRLMREASGGRSSSDRPDGGMLSQEGASSQMLNDLLGGKNPFLPDTEGGSSSSSSSSTALFESLLKNSSKQSMPGAGPLGDLSSILGAGSASKEKNGGALDGLAKSVLKNVVKRIEDESTQQQICKYLNAADVDQIMTYASLAGVPLSQATAEKLVKFANSVTPKSIGKSVKVTKRVLSAMAIIRKVSKVVSKYRHLLVLLLIIGWIKSSILRPIPVNKKAIKAAQRTAKAASMATFPM